jgi:SAM-dependent methyltransferase
MRYQEQSDAAYTIEENLRLEADAHDEDYEGRGPFGLPTLTFSKEQVWAINDHAWKPRTYRRGWRKRRLFELMDLPNARGRRMLEVGCGQGHNAVFFAMYGVEMHGFDLSPRGIDMARQIANANGVGEACHFRVANASAMPYPDHHFDAVVCNAVLHHVIKYPHVAEEIFRVLRPGGRLFFAEGVRDNALYRLVRRLRRKLQPVHYHGDIDLEMQDLDQLTRPYATVTMEQFGLLEKFAQGIGRDYDNGAAVRSVYRLASWLDRALLALIPPLRRQCLEVVGVATK